VKLDRNEISGGLGDCGLLIPIAVAMVAINGIGATAAFGGAGLAYIATALYFRVPFPVQPLKAFAAAAIALELSPQVIAAGALLMATAMALLAASRSAGWLAARFPLVLVRGIQASVALLLAKAAVELAERGNWSSLPPVPVGASAGLAIGCCAFLFWARARRIPGTPIVLAAGAAVGFAVGGAPSGLELGPQALGVSIPDGAAFGTALTTLVLAQLPLTFGNSVVATVDAEREYFGARASRVRPGAVASSIAAMNLFAGLFGALPMCHGAGGATAHYKLGARTAGATLAAGSLFLALAIAFGSTLPRLLEVLAPGALAGMLGFVAIQHGLLAMRLERAGDRALAAMVGAITLVTGNLAIGFGCGLAALLARAAVERLRELGAAPGGT
jgi:sulfate permease, SulP family